VNVCSPSTSALVVLWILSSVLLGAGYGDLSPFTSSTEQRTASATRYVAFEELFSSVRTFKVEGTNQNPVFRLTNVAVHDNLVFALDQSSATVTAFSHEGKLLYQVGRPGQGPGEFTNPYWIGFDKQGRIAVLEGAGNHRIQFLSPEDGRSVDVISEDLFVSRGSDDVYIEGIPGNQRFIFATQTHCRTERSNPRRRCVIHEHDITSEKMVRRFGNVDEVSPEGSSMPWQLGRDGEGRSYVASTTGSQIAVYDSLGVFEGRFRVDQQGTNFRPLDHTTLPEETRAAVKEMSRRSFSFIEAMAVSGDDVLVHHSFKSDERADQTYISVFKRDGAHQQTTQALDARKYGKMVVQDDRFFFVETDRQSDTGSYLIREYRYTGLDS
jgi:hypothetical protein